MTDYTLPIARRTRSREALMYRKLHEELKGKCYEKKRNAAESTSFSGFSDVKGRSSSGSCQKDNGSENLGLVDYGVVKGKSSSGSCQMDNGSDNLGLGDDVVEFCDLGPYDCVDKCDMGASNFENLGFECAENDDSEEMGWRESGRVDVEESCSRSKSNGEDDMVVVSISDSDSEEDDISSEESVEDSDDEDEIETSSSGESNEDSDDYYVGYVPEIPDGSPGFEELSGESEGEDESNKEEESPVSVKEPGNRGKGEDGSNKEEESPVSVKEPGNRGKGEDGSNKEEESPVSVKETASRGRGDGIEIRLKRKKLSDVCKNDISGNGKDDAVDEVQKKNCVSKRTRSRCSSESSEKIVGVGTVSHPICVDNEDLNDFGIEEVEDEEEHVQDLCGGQPSRKRIRAYEDHEVVQILANSILDKTEIPGEEIDEPVNEPVIEPSLPLKFTFGTEEQVAVEKSEEEKELEKLWAEMNLALCADDATDEKELAENAADVTPENELDTDALCQQGKHQYILDEEIGIKCKFCSFVNVEIKYCTAPFGRRTSEYSERRVSYAVHPNVFEELRDQNCGHDSQPGCDPFSFHARGTVWNIIPGIEKDLHEHQREGFKFLWKNIAGGIYLDKLKKPTSSDSETGGCIISHAPGTGKTRLAIVFLQTHLKLYPTCRPVIIAPSSMLLSWEAEFKKWKVNIPFHNLNKPKFSGKENVAAMKLFKSRQHSLNSVRMLKLYSWKNDTSILGISYKLFEELVGEDKKRSAVRQKNEEGMVRKILLELPGLLVLDEGHTPRNDQSQIWKALSKIRTEKRIILSGTPFQNNFDELYNTLCLARPKFADRISCKFNAFFDTKRSRKVNGARRNWASLTNSLGRVADDRVRAERLEEVRAMIRPFVHVHRGNILQQSLPGLRDAMIILEPPHFQKSLLDKVELTANRTAFDLEYLVTLVSVHPSLLLNQSFNLDDFGGRAMLEKLRLNPDMGVKTKFLTELIRLSIATDEKVLIFSQYLHPLTFICKLLESRFNWIEGKEILRMNGQVDTVQRQSLIKDFNNRNSQAKVMLASTRACCEGINLVGASRVVLLDVVWNPSVERQAISRAYRLGQEKVVYIYHLIASGTMEEEKYCRQAEKERLSELVFYSSEGAHTREKISSNVSEDEKDTILEEMIHRNKVKEMFKRIIYQPKDSNLVDSFGLVNL